MADKKLKRELERLFQAQTESLTHEILTEKGIGELLQFRFDTEAEQQRFKGALGNLLDNQPVYTYTNDGKFAVGVAAKDLPSIIESLENENLQELRSLVPSKAKTQYGLREAIDLPVDLEGSKIKISFPNEKSAEAIERVLSQSPLANNVLISRSIEPDPFGGDISKLTSMSFDIDEFNANKNKYPVAEYTALLNAIKSEMVALSAAEEKQRLDAVADTKAKNDAIEQKYKSAEKRLEAFFGLQPGQAALEGSKFQFVVNGSTDINQNQAADKLTDRFAVARNASGYSREDVQITFEPRMGKNPNTDGILITIDMEKIEKIGVEKFLQKLESNKSQQPLDRNILRQVDNTIDRSTSSIEKPLAEALAGTNLPEKFADSLNPNNYENNPSGNKLKGRESQKGWAVS